MPTASPRAFYVDLRNACVWMFGVGWSLSSPTNRKEVTRLKGFLKWLRRFGFRLKFELEASFNQDRDR